LVAVVVVVLRTITVLLVAVAPGTFTRILLSVCLEQWPYKWGTADSVELDPPVPAALMAQAVEIQFSIQLHPKAVLVAEIPGLLP
jgi:hypothetical protein